MSGADVKTPLSRVPTCARREARKDGPRLTVDELLPRAGRASETGAGKQEQGPWSEGKPCQVKPGHAVGSVALSGQNPNVRPGKGVVTGPRDNTDWMWRRADLGEAGLTRISLL